MNLESKQCQNCKKNFTIESDDFAFYEKIQVPAPTFCPDCRQLRRYAWRNERTLYRRNCDLCGKSTVTIYSPNKSYKVYCQPCFWSDGWDSKKYGRDFDFNRTFFDQWHELHLEVPRLSLLSRNSINSEYANHCSGNKNCYLVFATFDSENVLYSTRVLPGKDCCDCLSLVGKGTCELCYECVNCEQCYQCQYGYLLRNCQNCLFCLDCRNCSDCVLSWNLRNKKYCIENVQYSKEEYFEKIKEMSVDMHSKRVAMLDMFRNGIKDKAIYRSAIIEKAVNSSGNFLSYTKNAAKCFMLENSENAKYVIDGSIVANDCMDCYNFGAKSELTYECHAVVGCYANFFCHFCYENNHISYCDDCHGGENLFGCVGVKKGSYQILNKQYSKEEYESLVPKIIAYMKKTGEYGEFFPWQFSPFGYNETQGFTHRPMSKEEALAAGFKWEDQMPGTFGKTTLRPEDLPETISGVSEGITKEVLECVDCKKNYNVVPLELDIYKKMNIPIPRRCPDCRYRSRIFTRPPRQLWSRQCMCDKAGHDHSGHCPNQFETSYAPERKEIVYCEQCYNSEVV